MLTEIPEVGSAPWPDDDGPPELSWMRAIALALAVLMLLLTLAAAVSKKARGSEVPAAVDDPLFRYAVERSVKLSGKVEAFEEVMTARQARLVRNLGCGHYGCREEAERSLADMGPAAFRAACWGAWAKDAEVAMRCDRLLVPLMPCGHCRGSGVCSAQRGRSVPWRMPCERCHAYRWTSRWDPIQPDGCMACGGSGDSRPWRQPRAVEVDE